MLPLEHPDRIHVAYDTGPSAVLSSSYHRPGGQGSNRRGGEASTQEEGV